MQPSEQLQSIDAYVFRLFETEGSGHDYYHMKRVAAIAKEIAATELNDVFLVEAAALLHDINDEKIFSDSDAMESDLRMFLLSIDMDATIIDDIMQIITSVSFSKGITPLKVEGKIVQDADRLDAIGAIGIARTFAYAGATGEPICDPNGQSAIAHFHEKLLKLKENLHTSHAVEMAEERHGFLDQYLVQFRREWTTAGLEWME